MRSVSPPRRRRGSATSTPDPPTYCAKSLPTELRQSASADFVADLLRQNDALKVALHDSDARLENALAATGGFLHDFDAAGGMTADFGLTKPTSGQQLPRPSLAAECWREMVDPEDVARARAELAAAIARGDAEFVTKYRLRRQDGDVRVVRDHVFVERDPESRVRAATGVAVDVIKRQQRDARAAQLQAVTAALPAAPLIVAAGAPRLERVVRTILDNAIKYIPDGSDVLVRLEREDDGARSWAVLAIEDRGIGIPASDLPHVFERFGRGGNVAGLIAGSGIGLTGAQQIVAQHGGEITAECVEGEGSAFELRLPLVVNTA